MLHLQLLNCINVFVQNQVLEVPKIQFLLRQNQNRATADAETQSSSQPGKLEKAKRRAKTLETSKSEGLSREPTREAPPSFAPASPQVQKSEWPKLINLFSPSKNVRTK